MVRKGYPDEEVGVRNENKHIFSLLASIPPKKVHLASGYD